jgi:hypothetical protein
MPITIPIKDDTNHELTIALDGSTYRLRFLYNQLTDNWSIDINDEDNNPILSNLRLVPNFPLIKNYVQEGQPKGDFICNGKFDIQKITRNSFKDKDFELLYITEAEIGTL